MSYRWNEKTGNPAATPEGEPVLLPHLCHTWLMWITLGSRFLLVLRRNVSVARQINISGTEAELSCDRAEKHFSGGCWYLALPGQKDLWGLSSPCSKEQFVKSVPCSLLHVQAHIHAGRLLNLTLCLNFSAWAGYRWFDVWSQFRSAYLLSSLNLSCCSVISSLYS